jgi:hypothetical protein
LAGEREKAEVSCVLHKRSRVRQFMHVQNAMWHCVSCCISSCTIWNPCFDTNKHCEKQITHFSKYNFHYVLIFFHTNKILIYISVVRRCRI